ncbi:hypothetical protein GWK08_18080 [Leptobacterium flavescens]|uniref:HTH LytTR-type domain-containing protein n=1 Tax=Leptobacterium flavescens TaxID=472055 RepID=A0A6P0UU61_9FLAO|nr:LytTR family DNA-binding domain-containing protein [Leptobacterium flavescens]NER15369.1 hypothetical protein [Leptobacterium flavescens]
MKNNGLKRSDYQVLGLYFILSVIVIVVNNTYGGHSIGKIVLGPLPYLVTTIPLVGIFYLWLIPKYIVKSQNYILFFILTITSLIVFGYLYLSLLYWMEYISIKNYPLFPNAILKSLDAAVDGVGLPLGILLAKKHFENEILIGNLRELQKKNEDELSQAQVNSELLFKNLDLFKSIKQTVFSKKRDYKKRFVIKKTTGLLLLDSSNLSVVEAMGDSCKLIDVEGKVHLFSQNISKVLETLDPKDFFRINRSQIINIDHIVNIENHFKNRLLLQMKGVSEKMMTSSSKTSDFRLWLEEH